MSCGEGQECAGENAPIAEPCRFDCRKFQEDFFHSEQGQRAYIENINGMAFVCNSVVRLHTALATARIAAEKEASSTGA